MKPSDILRVRLYNQQLSASSFKTPRQLVSWLGVMQAQEFIFSKWAIGIRLPGCTEKMVEQAINEGEIIRTHVLRPTWHYIAPEDLHWMLALSAPQIKAAMKFQYKSLGFTEAIVKKSNKLIGQALSKGEHLTRKEIVAILKKEKIDAQNEKGGHLLIRAELDGLIGSGAIRGKEITYALLAQRVHPGNAYSREEALAKLAQRYFTSHGPATVRDFIWWSGLSVTDGKIALASIKNEFESAIIGGQEYWFSPDIKIPEAKISSCHLLPPYDEYIIAYADRSALLGDDEHKKNIFQSGLFRPTIVVNGKVVGIWKRGLKKDRIVVEPQYFKAPAKTTIVAIKKAAKAYGKFLGQQIITPP